MTWLLHPHTSAEPPVFVKRLEAATVWKQGSTSRLQCTIKGSPELHTTWFFNNSELSAGGRYSISLKNGVATLEIQEVMLSDSGNYTCETVFIIEPNLQGSVAVLACELSGSSPFEVIMSQGAVTSLEIHSFEMMYRKTQNRRIVIFVALSTVVYIIITNTVISEPPMFSKRIESATAVLGNTVKLQGTLKGSAPITVKWMKDSELLRDDDPNVKMKYENNITSISFSSVEIKHSGKYTCVAENEAGQQKCEALSDDCKFPVGLNGCLSQCQPCDSLVQIQTPPLASC
uniref:Ig-like domain-containing protein n=1 Tax=Seriola lalandi dorsalis TaxID=1841481 RepID=A0A3B4WNS5_SERLL